MKEAERERRFLREISRQGLNLGKYQNKLENSSVAQVVRDSDKPEVENAANLANKR